jgi:hypothetical protein
VADHRWETISRETGSSVTVKGERTARIRKVQVRNDRNHTLATVRTAVVAITASLATVRVAGKDEPFNESCL